MRYLAAYVLCVMGGKEEPTLENIQTVLGSVGVDCDVERVNMVINRLKGKSVDEIISTGQSLLATVSCGATTTSAVTVATTDDAAKTDVALKDDDKRQESDDDSDDGEGMLSLFDD